MWTRLRLLAGLALPLALLFTATGCGGPDVSVIPAADYFEVVPDAFTVGDWDETYDDPGHGELFGPHFSLELDGTIARRLIDGRDAGYYGLADPHVAPSGYEILLAHFTDYTLNGRNSWRTDGKRVDAELLIGDRVEKLDPAPEPGSLIAVMVKTGEHAYLSVTDEGRTQELSLRDGTRREEVPEYYGSPRYAEFTAAYREEGTVKAKGETRSMNCEITFDHAFRDAWHPEFGWAKEGRVWLVLEVRTINSDGHVWHGLDDPLIEWDFSLAESFSVKTNAGDEARALDDDVISDLMFNMQGFNVAFDVPADMTGGTLLVHPDGKMRAVWSDTEVATKWSKKPPRGELPIIFTAD